MRCRDKWLSASVLVWLLIGSFAWGGTRQAGPTSTPITSGRWRVDGRAALLRYAPDGKSLFVLASSMHLSGGVDASECVLHRLDAADGKSLGRLETLLTPSFSHFSATDSVVKEPPHWCISPDGQLLAEVQESGAIRVRELSTGRVRVKLTDNRDRFAYVRFTPDGRRLAATVIPSEEAQADPKRSSVCIRLWEVATGKEALSVSVDAKAERGMEAFLPGVFSFAPDGRRLVVIGSEKEQKGVVRIWDLEGKKSWRLAGHGGMCNLLAFSPDGKRLAEVSGKKLRLWDVATGKQVRELGAFEDGCEGLAFTPDGKRLLASVSYTLRQWDLASGRELAVLGTGVQGFTLAPDGRSLALAEAPDTVRLVKMEDGKEVGRWQVPLAPLEAGASFHLAEQGAGWSVAFSPDGSTLAAATSWGVIRRWSVATGKELPLPEGLDMAAPVLAVSPDGKLVASAGYGEVTLWDIATGALVRRLPRSPGPPQRMLSREDWPMRLVFDPAGKRIAAGWQDGMVTVWDVATARPPLASWMHQHAVADLVFAEEGGQLISADDWQMAWHEVSTGRQIRLWSPESRPEGREAIFALSPAWTAVTQQQDHCTLWELATGKPRRRLDVSLEGGKVSPDGRYLLASKPGTLALVDLETGKEVRHLASDRHRGGMPRSYTFSTDGKWIAAGGSTGIDVWEAATASPLCHLTEHRGGVRALAFTPAGQLISAGEDLTLLRWDLHSLQGTPPPREVIADSPAPRQTKARQDEEGEPLPVGALARLGSLRFQHGNPVGELRYLPDGTLLSSVRDREQRKYEAFFVWDAGTGKRRQRFPVSLNFLDRALRLDLGYRRPPHWCLSPDGRLVALAGEKDNGEEGPVVQVRQLATGKLLWEVKDKQESFRSLQFSPDGKRLAAVCSGTEGVRLYDAASGLEQCRLGPPGDGRRFQPLEVSFAPDGGSLAVLGTGTPDAPVCIYDSSGLRLPLSLPEKSLEHSPVVFTPDSRVVAMVSRPTKDGKGRLRLWSAVTGKLLRDLGEHDRASTGLLFSPDGTLLVSQQDVQVQMWDVRTGKVLWKVMSKEPTAVFSPDGRILAVSCAEAVCLYESRSGKLLRQIEPDPDARLVPWTGEYSFTTAQQGLGRALAFSANGTVLAATHGQTIRRWNPRTGKEINPLPGHNPIAALAVSADGRRIAAGSSCYVVLWEAGGKVLHRLPLEPASGKKPALISCVVLSPDGRHVAAGSGEGDVALWRADGTRLWQERCHSRAVAILDFSEDGRTLLSTSEDGRGLWHDVETGRQLRQRSLAGEPRLWDASGTLGMAVAGGRLLARGQGGVQMWELASGKLQRTVAVEDLDETPPNYPCLAISADGRLVAVRIGEDCIQLVDAATGKVLRACAGLSLIEEMAFAPDGRLLAAAGLEGELVWETATGTILARLGGHRGPAASVAFSADGRTLATGGEDSTVLVWDVPALVRKPAQGELSVRQLSTLWEQLADRNAATAHAAALKLAHHPRQAIALVGEKVRPMPEGGQRAVRLIAQLDDSSFTVREQASKELARLGGQAEAALHKALAEDLSLELRRRIEALLDRLRGPVTEPEELRALRAVELLEGIGSVEAYRQLEVLAGGARGARLTRTAKAGLQRVKQRRS